MECAQSNGAGAVLCPPAFRREPGASQNGKPSERAHQVARLVRAGGGSGQPLPPAALPTNPTAQTSGLGLPESGTCCACHPDLA